MRVHLRGVVIGVGVLLGIVMIISLFNAIDSPPDTAKGRSRHALSMETGDMEDEEGLSPSRMSPRSSTRLGAAGGGARASPRAAGSPRAGGVAGGRVGGAAGGRIGGAGVAGGPRGGARDEAPSDFDDEEGSRPRGARAAGGLAVRPAPVARGGEGAAPARGRAVAGGPAGSRAGAAAPKHGVPKKSSKARSVDSEGDEAEGPQKKKKKEPPYPDWWKTSYARSSVVSVLDQFVGDQPLFPECPTFDAGTGGVKIRRFGLVDPPNFMRNSKNPCWFEFNGKKDIVKCVPYFYIPGVPKAGVEDLFTRVREHPSVMRGGATSYSWWDRSRYGASKMLKYTREAKRGDDLVGLKDYAKELVADHGKNITKELLYLGKSESVFGDATPTYLVENTQWDVFEGNEGCTEPRVLPATFIRHMYPDARLIIMLRNPTDRLYSRFLESVPYVEEFENHTASLFHTFTLQAVKSYKECFAKTSIRHCAYNTSLFTNAVIRLSEGMYSVFLEDWFRIFTREQILILKFEDYIKDVQGHLQQVFDHLSVGKLDEMNMQKLADMPMIRHGRTRAEEGYMLSETYDILKEFYEPFLMKLADMLDDKKWLFQDNQVVTAAVRSSGVHGVDVEEEEDNMPKQEGDEEGEEEEEEENEEEDMTEEEEDEETGADDV